MSWDKINFCGLYQIFIVILGLPCSRGELGPNLGGDVVSLEHSGETLL